MVSCGGSFALSTGTIVHDSHPSEVGVSESVPSSVKSENSKKISVNENFKAKVSHSQSVKKDVRERSFGENIGNTSGVNEASKDFPVGDEIEAGLNSYVELLKR